MKKVTSNSFNEGLLMDMNPLVTPQTCLSDCLNGTLITFNGNEFTLQSDNGNVKIDRAKIANGYVPVGAKEYGGILYLALLNPETGDCEIGSIPSPDYDSTPKNFDKNGIDVTFKAEPGNYNKLIKLFERDQLVINPGDEYQILEQGNRQKLYQYKYKIFDSNEKMYDLKNPNIYQNIPEGDNKPFAHTISSTLGLEIELDNIKYFDSYAFMSKGKIIVYSYAENNLQIDNDDEDDIYICEIKCILRYKLKGAADFTPIIIDNKNLQRVKNLSHKFEIDLPALVGNPNLTLNDFEEEVLLNILPITEYEELDYLSKNLEVNLTKIPEFSEENTIFKYFYNKTNKNLRLEFDYNFNPELNTSMYVEFYDIWSDCSTIITLEDPNPFGKNITFTSVSNSKLLKYENGMTSVNGSIGGITDRRELDFNTIDSHLQNVPLITQQYIRSNAILRENNLYICAIHKVINDDGIITTQTLKKPLILSDSLNSKFNDDDIMDMTILTNDKIKINTKSEIETVAKSSSKKISSSNTLKIKTGEYYYNLGTSNLTNSDGGMYYDLYSTSNSFKINNSIESTTSQYGLIELNNIRYVSALSNLSKIYDNIENESRLNLIKESDKYTLSLESKRKIKTSISAERRDLRFHDNSKDITLWSTIYKNNIDENLAGIEMYDAIENNMPTAIRDVVTGTQLAKYDSKSAGNSRRYPIDDIHFTKMVNKQTGDGITLTSLGSTNFSKKYSGFTCKYNEVLNKRWWMDRDTHERMRTLFGEEKLNYYLIMYSERSDGNVQHIVANYNNKADLISFMKDIFVPISISNKTMYLNYYSDIEDNGYQESIASGQLETTISADSELVQYYFNGSSFVKGTYSEILNNFNISYNDNYLDINSPIYNDVKYTELPELKIGESIDFNIKNKLINSLSDLETNEAESLIDSSLVENVIYSKSNRWSTATSKFQWEQSDKRFKLLFNDVKSVERSTYYKLPTEDGDYQKNNFHGIDYTGNNYVLNSNVI